MEIIESLEQVRERKASPEWVRVAGMSKRYGSLDALAGVEFSIRRPEILGLIGPNGAGKTTLFECMAGVLPPTAGVVFVDSQPISLTNRSRTLFYLPDAIAPWPSQTVRWALDFTMGFFGGRSDLLSDVIEGLSLTPQPVLLADEPFEGLDLRQSREVANILRAHALSGRTLFLSIHQIADAARICDRFILLSGGRVCGEGTLEELSSLARSRGAPASTLEEVFLALT